MDTLLLAQGTSILSQAGITVLAAASAFGAVVGLQPFVGRLVRRQEETFHEALAEMFLFDVSPRQLTYVMIGAAAVVGAFFALVAKHTGITGIGIVGAFVVGMAFGFWVPRLVIFVLQRRRRDKLNEQLVDGLVTLANGMRAGLNLVQSMQLIEQNTQPPISQEFGLMLREFEHGTSVDEVLRRAARRIKLHHYKLLFAAMETARRRGGNLPETLDRLSESLREIVRLEEKVRSLTAQNRLSALMMGCMPLVVAVIYYFIEPGWVQILWEDPWGLLLLALAIFLNIVGFLWIRKIVTFEI
jgi:tight adherence protein B